MRLIIDSGSSKMEWILLDGETVRGRFNIEGFNPNYSDRQDLENKITSVEAQCCASQIREVHYYGTGCGSEKNCQLIKEVFQPHFSSAKIYVTHDLMAVCHAVLGHEKGIACILGTGSNSCVYDGEKIVEKAVSLGYLVGDEGSGCHIGREMVKAYFYGFMPEELRSVFLEQYHLNQQDFVQHLYHCGQPSKYLASFAKFAGEHQNEPFIHELVQHCFDDFIKAFVCRFQECKQMKVSFVGSVAFHFQEILRECLLQRGFAMGSVMQAPAEGLVKYYSIQK